MKGTFPNTLLVVTGCAGLVNSEMAQAFVARGAEVYVSWDQIVLANQSDGGAILLIQSMTTGHTVDDAVTSATENAPSSPLYSSQLRYYPLDRGGVVLSL
jgi:nucleoside-diphosphate-sugar epimerase